MASERDKLRDDLRVWGRRALRSVWQRSVRGENLSEEERRLAAILDEHPEFAPVWDAGEAGEAIDPESGEINPYLHIEIHMMVESQIALARPPEVPETVERLQDGGLTRHEAVHAVGKALTLEMHHAIQGQRPLDGDSYVRALSQLRP
jgi:hypothetical protein